MQGHPLRATPHDTTTRGSWIGQQRLTSRIRRVRAWLLPCDACRPAEMASDVLPLSAD